jgi:Protein of unknown function (DUF2490)
MIRWLACFSLLTCITLSASGQKHDQLWFDYQLDHPFANRYLFEVTGSYQTVLTNTNKWHNFSITPTFEYALSNRFDLIGTMPIVYTLQVDTINSAEIDPSLGTRYHITQNHRIDTRLIFKAEQRVYHQQEDNAWETSKRIRLKAEATFAINGPNLFRDKLWYGITDYEEFFVLDRQLEERFANRRRARLGVGYRKDYKHRFELIYTWQSSRDEIQGKFVSVDNVIQLRYKLFLNPSKPLTPVDQ